MYEILAVLAAFGLVYSIFAGRIERTWISGPIVFTCPSRKPHPRPAAHSSERTPRLMRVLSLRGRVEEYGLDIASAAIDDAGL